MTSFFIHLFCSIGATLTCFILFQNLNFGNQEISFSEIFQVLTLFGITIFASVNFYKIHKNKNYHAYKNVIVFIILLTITLIGRETSWGSAYGLADPISDIIEYSSVSLIIIGAAYSLYRLIKLRFINPVLIRNTLKMRFIKYGFVSFILMGLGAVFDKKIIMIEGVQTLEELFEIFAYLYYGLMIYTLYQDQAIFSIKAS